MRAHPFPHVTLVLWLLLGLCFSFSAHAEQTPPDAKVYLETGQLARGVAASHSYLASNPQDQNARLGLGAMQFFRGLERLSQNCYRYGLNAERFGGAGLGFALPQGAHNPNPETISYPKFRQMILAFDADMAQAQQTLKQVRSPAVKLKLNFGRIRLDFNGDGKAGKAERFSATYTAFTPAMGQQTNNSVPISFDLGDAYWLTGYTHVLRTFTNLYLGYNGKAHFEHTAHLFFPKVKSPYPMLSYTPPQKLSGFEDAPLADAVTYFHLISSPVADKRRLKVALLQLEGMTQASRASWQAILAETDNDHEWLPNPKQRSILGVRVNKAQIDAWLGVMTEVEAILEGKKLIPHWRVKGEGVNLRRVLLEPRRFDLVLWLQGSAATPYLESGALTRGDTWNALRSYFGGNFPGFVIWFN